MNILKATADFEQWLAGQLPIIRQDLALKHQHMAEAAFPFFRATFYRWLQLWPELCPDLVKAPPVLGVGDLHIENFGTWRDEEGRLIWGVNDLDEAWPAAYTLDLVRLTTSVYVAIGEEHLTLSKRVAAEAIEEGYRDALAAGGKAFILAEDHRWLRLIALGKLRDPVHFWNKLEHLPPYTAKPPEEVRKLLESSLPYARVIQVAGSIHRPGSEGDSAFRVGVGQEGLFRGNLLRKAGTAVDSRAGSLRAFPRPLGGAAPGARLLANRARVPFERSRRSAAALCHGLGNRQHALCHAASHRQGKA